MQIMITHIATVRQKEFSPGEREPARLIIELM